MRPSSTAWSKINRRVTNDTLSVVSFRASRLFAMNRRISRRLKTVAVTGLDPK